MGCWGVTAFESDAGLDSMAYIRNILPQDGRLELGKVIEALQKDDVRLPDVHNAESHTSPMALTEIVVKFIDHKMEELDYGNVRAANGKKFTGLTSFSASRESLQWLREYLSDTLKCARKNAELQEGESRRWNGWFEEKDWIGWQKHMVGLVKRLDMLLSSSDGALELIPSREQGQSIQDDGAMSDIPHANMGWKADDINDSQHERICAENYERLSYDLASGTRQLFALEKELNGKEGTFCEWLRAAYEINEDFDQPLAEVIDEICSAFRESNRLCGQSLTQQLYNAHIIILPTEIKVSAQYLSLGGRLESLSELARVGFLLEDCGYDEMVRAVQFMNAGGKADAVYEQMQGTLPNQEESGETLTLR